MALADELRRSASTTPQHSSVRVSFEARFFRGVPVRPFGGFS